MSIARITIEATGGQLAVLLDTDDLQKIFRSTRAINVNWISVIPLTLGAAIEVQIKGDWQMKESEFDEDDSTTIPFTQIIGLFDVDGATGRIRQQGILNDLFFRFTTVHVDGITKFPSSYPIFNNLVIGWDSDLDFDIEIDFTRLDAPWDFREELMDLLANKRRVEDPNISNVRGKRSLIRAPLRLAIGE